MIITIRMSNGSKITKEQRFIAFTDNKFSDIDENQLLQGVIYVNKTQVVDIRNATPEEIEHSKNHGW